MQRLPQGDRSLEATLISLGPPLQASAPSPPDRPRPKHAGLHDRCHDTLFGGGGRGTVPASEDSHSAQAMQPTLTVGPTQGLEEQIALHADSRHGESGPLRLRGERDSARRQETYRTRPFPCGLS